MSNYIDLKSRKRYYIDRDSIANANWTNINVFMVGECILNDVILVSEPLDRKTKGKSTSLTDLQRNTTVFVDLSRNTTSFVRSYGRSTSFTDIDSTS